MMGKRSFDATAAVEEDYVDDIAVAAHFAMAQPEIVVQLKAIDDDKNEIDLASSSSTSSSAQCHEESSSAVVQNDVKQEQTAESESANIDAENEEENDPDDLDIAARTRALEQMLLEGMDSSSDEEGKDGLVAMKEETKTIKKPLSKNEIDVYETSIVELQKRLNWNLDVGTIPLPTDHSSWAIAGHVRQHVVSERTIVILTEIGCTLLEEGTLLALRPTPNVALEGQELPRLIPLGKILEVFGPVSRPLYSLRLISFDGSIPAVSGIAPTKSNSTASPTEKSESEEGTLTDPWGPTGLFTRYLKNNPNLPVYFLPRGSSVTTKVLDTAVVYKNSRRGCDASNLYDEEIDPNEMEYSDDEQERNAKSKNRRGSRRNEREPRETITMEHSSNPTKVPRGFHRPGPSSQPGAELRSEKPTTWLPFASQQLSGPGHIPVAHTPTIHTNEQADDDDTEYYDFS